VVDAANGCFADVDVIQFERLLSNLLTNAFKYTPAGGDVRASLSRKNAGVELVIEDTGRGIPPEHLPHIFDRFYRVPTAESAAEKGMGLGLNFVAWIAKAHGGRVDVESAPGRGSRFIVTLPVMESAASGRLPDEVQSAPAPGVRS
jgi:signal transduction histidine kinase